MLIVKKRGRPKKIQPEQTQPEQIQPEQIQPEQTQIKQDFPYSENKKNEVENLKADFIEEKSKSEKKVRIPKKEKEKESELASAFAKTVSITLSAGFDLICRRLPKGSPLSSDEKIMFDDAVNGVITKYYPDLSKYGSEFNLALALSFILIPRISFKSKNKKEVPKNENEIKKEFDEAN